MKRVLMMSMTTITLVTFAVLIWYVTAISLGTSSRIYDCSGTMLDKIANTKNSRKLIKINELKTWVYAGLLGNYIGKIDIETTADPRYTIVDMHELTDEMITLTAIGESHRYLGGFSRLTNRITVALDLNRTLVFDEFLRR